MMSLNEDHPANLRVLASLNARASRRGKKLGPVAPPDGVKDPYRNCGSPPDVVARVWGELGATLPANGRCLIFGIPALVHPRSGVVLAVCYGTAYCLRLPAGSARTRRQTIRERADEGTTDLDAEFGPGWVFGEFRLGEIDALRDLYREFNTPAEGTTPRTRSGER